MGKQNINIDLRFLAHQSQRLKWAFSITWPEFAKLHMGLVVLVKKMTILINFLLQNTNLVSVLSKICPNFAGHVWQDWHISRTLLGICRLSSVKFLHYNLLWMVLFQNCVWWPFPTSKITTIEVESWKVLKSKFFLRTTRWNETKFDPISPWGSPCVLWPHQLSKMATMADYFTFPMTSQVFYIWFN